MLTKSDVWVFTSVLLIFYDWGWLKVIIHKFDAETEAKEAFLSWCLGREGYHQFAWTLKQPLLHILDLSLLSKGSTTKSPKVKPKQQATAKDRKDSGAP